MPHIAQSTPGGEDLIVFVATWCWPCRRQLQDLWKRPRTAVYFIDSPSADSVAALVDTLSARVVTGAPARIFADSLGGVPGLPSLFVLRDRTIAHRLTGFRSRHYIDSLVTSR